MFPSAVLLLAAARAVLGATAHGGNWIPEFKNFVAFGDSYTDENRLSYFQSHNGTGPPPGTLLPPSTSTPGGGVTWARFVADNSSATLYNYAVSGAVCSNEIIYRLLSGINGPFPDVIYEADAFVADTKYINASTETNTLYPDRKADNTVYSIWIGTNDLGTDAFLTDSSLNGTTIPDYIDCIFDRLDTIYKAGGRYFVLMKTAPLQLSPLYGAPPTGLSASHYWVDKPDNRTEISDKMEEYTQLVNSVFDYRAPYELLVANRYPDASIAVYDVHSLLTDVYHNPSEYLDSPANVTSPYYLCDVSGQNCATQPGKEIGQFMWYDELHPSQKTDETIAKEFLKLVKGSSDYATYWS